MDIIWLCDGILLLGLGFIAGKISVWHYRHNRIALVRRHSQLQVLSLEIKSLRFKVIPQQGKRTPPAKRLRELPC